MPVLAVVLASTIVVSLVVLLLIVGLPFFHSLIVDLLVRTLAFDTNHEGGMPVTIVPCAHERLSRDALEWFGGGNLIDAVGHARVIFECALVALIRSVFSCSAVLPSLKA